MNWFKKKFNNKKVVKNQDDYHLNEDEVFFHEDFYCQVELIPSENFNELKSENERINKFASEHFDGIGFNDIYIRNDHKVKTNEKKINIVDFEKILLNNNFLKMRTVYSGYGNYKQICKNTIAYSIDQATVFFDYDNTIINNIWLDGFRFRKDSKFIQEMINCLHQIGIKFGLLLNDWDLTEVIDLCNKDLIEIYIMEK